MVHVPTRGDVPVRLGPSIGRNVPDFGGSLLDRQVYADPVRFELERERVLNRTWLIAGRSESIPNAGDWISFESHGETVVIVRQPDGSVRSFHNVCPHRGPSFVTDWQGCGATEFRCPYHGWTFDLTGKVKGVPERIDFDPDHLRDARSPEVAVDEWGGWLWVNLAGPEHAPSLRSWIGDDILADLGQYRMDEMVLLETLEFDVPVSYKAIVDGFNELYHAAALHGSSKEWVKAARDTTFWFVNDHNYMQIVPRHQHREQLEVEWDHHKYAICHYVVFPNTVFNCNPEHVQVFNPIPIDVDRTRFICWQLVYPDRGDDPDYPDYHRRMTEHWTELQRIVGEDIAIYEQLKRTKRSSAYVRNILSERECKIGHYHRVMDEMIRDDADTAR